MQRLLDYLERRFGRYAFDNLTLVLVTAQAATLVLSLAKPGFAQLLVLDPAYVAAGQYWRLFSYLFLPPSFSPLWALFALYWLHTMGTALETEWGAFRYQLYWLVGTALTALGAFAFQVRSGNEYLLMSLFLAFATLWPRYRIMLFFIISVEVRWLALLDALLLCAAIGTGDGWGRLMPALAVGNYLLFFTGPLLALLRGRAVVAARSKERQSFAAAEREVSERVRRCAICGISSDISPDTDFRVCSCAKHEGKPTELCLEHARNH
jgi:membrane associated rhomboid family serine protease